MCIMNSVQVGGDSSGRLVSAVHAHAPMKCAGGKRKLLPEIRKHVPAAFGDYYEPFLGGASVFFDLVARGVVAGKRAHLGDVNSKLMAVFEALQEDAGKVIRRLEGLAKSRTVDDAEKHYYKIRAKNFGHGDVFERAADFLYVNRLCFNGLMRENRKGEFNVPYGKYENPTICDRENLEAVHTALRGVELKVQGFPAWEKCIKKGDFVYFDPPYVPLTKTSNFTSYSSNGFGMKEQTDLRDMTLRLKKRGVHVLLSNSSADVTRELYKDKAFEVIEVHASRAINSKVSARGKVAELLIR